MRSVLLLFALLGSASSQTAPSTKPEPKALTIEVRTSSSHARMTDEITVSVFFRSPDKTTTIWNALSWAPWTGLHLEILDSSGHEVEQVVVPSFPVPPDRTGKDELISIGGSEFAGFEEKSKVKWLFPKPGKYTLKCSYYAPLPRDYFHGTTIWGREDGFIESPTVTVIVDK